MKILYIHQYFKTPADGGALRSYFIANAMANRGWEVEMITAHNEPRYEKKMIEGITVHYLPVPYYNEFSFRQRMWAFMKFVRLATKLIRRLPHADICYATSTPLTVGLIALRAKKIMKIPYIFEVRDLWPEAPIALGVLKNPVLKYYSRKLEKKIYSHATAIVALSPGMEEAVRKTAPDHDIYLIPNMADTAFFEGMEETEDKNRPFSIGYFGAFGRANHLEYLLHTAKACTDAGLDVRFLMAGEGAEKKMLEKKAKSMGLTNMEILPFQNRENIRSLMARVDACYTSFLNVPVLQTASPNKFFDGLAAGRLSIVNTSGWLRELVERHQCGFYADPEKPEAFPSLVRPYLDDKKLLKSQRQHARNLAASMFAREKLTNQVCEIIEKVVTKGQ